MGDYQQMYTNSMRYGGMMPNVVKGGIGQSLAPQETARISILNIMTNETLEHRRRNMRDNPNVFPFNDPAELTIKAREFVFMERKQGNDPIGDGNPFSSFNGLVKEEGLWRYYKKYRFAGVACDEFPYVAGSLGPSGLDLQVAGVVNWENGGNRTAYPGEMISWMPEDAKMVRAIQPGSKLKRPAMPGTAIKTILFPIDIEKELENADNQTVLGQIAAVAPPGTTGAALTVMRYRNVVSMIPIHMGRVVGINMTTTGEGCIGQMMLVIS